MKMRQFLTTILAVVAAITVSAQSNRIGIDDFVIERDSIVSVPVTLANDTPMRGLQFNLAVPDGLKIEAGRLTKYSEKYDMNLVCRKSPKDGYVVFVYPMSRVCYPAGSEVIMVLDFCAASGFRGGEIHINHARGSTINNQSIPIEDATVTVTVPASPLIDQSPDTPGFF